MDEFFRTLIRLKKVPRQGWIDKAGISNPESVADHSYSVAVMAMVLGEAFGMNAFAMVKMALLHDLAESVTGDITPDMAEYAGKAKAESAAMDEILGGLPEPVCAQYRSAWDEYSRNESAESRMVHEIDKLEMALQASLYAGGKESDGERLQVFIDAAKDAVKDPRLKSILESFQA